MNQAIADELSSYATPDKIPDYMRFFKTGKGEYAEGDKFLGIKVPDTRKVVKKYFKTMSFDEIKAFLYSPYHEHRLFALLVLVAQYQSKDFEDKKAICGFYIKHIDQINNWDLVDVTAPHILGDYLLKDRKHIHLLYSFSHSSKLWRRRIAIISSFAFIKVNNIKLTLELVDYRLIDEEKHDLMHKAMGWAIRKVGDKDLQAMLDYLKPRYKKMPRTMLRYAIEKLDEPLRQAYLKGER